MNKTIWMLNEPNIIKQIAGVLLLFSGAYYLLFYGNTSAFFYVVFGLILWLRSGTELDLENKKYRLILSLFGLKVGLWEALPEIEYLSVFKTDLIKKYQIHVASTHRKVEIIKILLFFERNKRIEVYQTQDIDNALNKAKFIADVLKIEILDATKKPSQWLKNL